MVGYRRKKLELVAVAIILSVLMGFSLRTLNELQREIEEAAVHAEVASLRVELLDRLSHREIAGGRLPDGDNPVDWAGRAPLGYSGEHDTPPQERGVWYFDRKAACLVFLGRHGRDYRFRLVRSVQKGGAPGTFAGIGLVRVENAGNEK